MSGPTQIWALLCHIFEALPTKSNFHLLLELEAKSGTTTGGIVVLDLMVHQEDAAARCQITEHCWLCDIKMVTKNEQNFDPVDVVSVFLRRL